MRELKLLDVTLRDGGYKTNFHFPLEIIKHTLTELDQSGIQYIEVGYRNGSFKPIPNIGPSGMCSKAYLEYCKKFIQLAKLTVIFHPKNVQKYDMEDMRDCGVDSVRICFPSQNPTLGFNYIEMARQCGFEVFVNITRASQYSLEQLYKLALEISAYDIKAIYLADSNGNLTPDKINNIFSFLRKNCKIDFGFHAHDNLFSAQANAIAAIHNDVKYIDASLYGLGKGVGNLRTEGIVSLLCSQGNTNYDLCKILQLADYIKLKVQGSEQELLAKDIIRGVFNLSQDDAVNLGSFLNIEDYYNTAKQYAEKNNCLNVQYCSI